MIRNIKNKLLNNQTFSNVKIIILILLFICAALYALFTIKEYVYSNEYSKSLSCYSLKLDKSKKYRFVNKYTNPSTIGEINIPFSNLNLPDSLCVLYYDNEWKLELTEKLRKSHKDNDEKSILFPFCRLNKTLDKNLSDILKFDFEKNFKFFTKEIQPTQNDLLVGVKFNNASGKDAFVIKIEKKGNEFELTNGLGYINKWSIPISENQKNIIELDFNSRGDTITNNKNIFAFPFKSEQKIEEIKNLIIEDNKLIFDNKFIPLDKDEITFSVNNIVFKIKNNFKNFYTFFLIPFLYLILLVFNFKYLRELYLLSNKTENIKHRNIVKIEIFNILSIKILFNCIIFLGFPLLLLRSIESNDKRLLFISIFVIFLNINWYPILIKINNYIKNNISKLPLVSFLIVVITFFLTLFTNNELLFGIFPILKIITIFFIFLPFALSYIFNKFPKLNLTFIRKYVPHFFKSDEHQDRTTRNEVEEDFLFNLKNYTILFFIISIVSIVFAKDLATIIFFSLSLLLIMVINTKRLINFIFSNLKNFIYVLPIVFFAVFIFSSVFTKDEKQYRLYSIYYFPNDNELNKYSNIESSRETIVNQLFLLNSVENRILPDFKNVILPEFKTVFFTDYGVLWSFKIGGWFWFSIYFLVLLTLSYSVISLIIIFSKPIRLSSKKVSNYNKKIVFGINLLLAILLIQYIYTFLTNFWALPLTGQSSGLLSPSYFEYFFHIIILNYLFVYLSSSIDERKLISKNEASAYNYSTSYYNVKLDNWFVFTSLIIFTVSIIFMIHQYNRIDDKLYTNDYKLAWKIPQDESLDSLKNLSKDTLLILANKSYNIMENDAKEYRKYLNYVNAYFDIKEPNLKYSQNRNYVVSRTSIDSLINIKKIPLSKKNKAYGIYKYVNGKEKLFINNRYYSGCPPNSETINFELQVNLNKELEKWATKIDAITGYKLIGGSIIMAENKTGNILASASYPLLYNENDFHILFENNKINNFFKNNKIDSTETLKIRFNNSLNPYINFSEFDIMPGSIVKPLLAYSGLKYLPNRYSQEWLSNFLGWSINEKSKIMFKDLFIQNHFYESSIKDLKNDFDFFPYTYNYNDINPNNIESHSIGQQQKLIFKNIVQAYIRIKLNKKINLSYNKNENNKILQSLSLDEDNLTKLRNSMCALRNGTAKDNVGLALTKKGVDINNFIAKTGTAEILGSENYNRTSSIIIVGNEFTVGIQLYGLIPNTKSKLDAKSLCKELIESNIVKLK
ncbi:hypothetical protein [Chryseobacterium gambrini]|uniref:hypothetical protein n=1 Tax=Chryseobacterium gambrini TaxID=373672 RepID=UPI0022F3CCD0|nr:hypothetical protein [Chryseobacterium gambrini]WBX97523.1 hypothetical protein PE065_22150 [Chryseobacterium gambrini]